MTKNMPRRNDSTAKAKDAQAIGHSDDSNFSSGDQNENDSVDRIRDILFGAQVRQYEQKFRTLEETIRKEAANLHDATKKSVEALEIYVKKQLESLTAQIKAEQKDRTDSMKEFCRTFENSDRNLEKKLNTLDEKANSIQHDLQEQLLQQSKTLTKEIDRKHEEVIMALKKASEELRKEKIDRLALGNLFNEMGLRLKEEFKIPNIK